MKKRFLSCVAAGALAVGLVSTAIAGTNTDNTTGISKSTTVLQADICLNCLQTAALHGL